MKVRASQELFAHWNERRGLRRAPDRGDIDPAAIRNVLGDTFILANDGRGTYAFRIAGTRLCALFGRELKGRSFCELWDAAQRASIGNLLTIIGHEQSGVVAGVTAHIGNGESDPFELLLLPLRHGGRPDQRVLGALTPITPVRWLGARQIETLVIAALRHLDVAPPMLRALPAYSPPGRHRRGLMVYDGGLSRSDKGAKFTVVPTD
jgi:hypothetical protein